MELEYSVAGRVRLRITCADPEAVLTEIADRGVILFHAVRTGPLTVSASVARRALPRLEQFLKRRGDSWEILGKTGFFWKLRAFFRRPVLVGGLALLFICALLLSGRVFFIRVAGNSRVPARWILEQAENCGIRFGVSRRSIRSEPMKNALLEAIPQLEWAGVNTKGCTAVITVREQTPPEPPVCDQPKGDLVAARDGIIRSVTVLRGTGLCRPGQAVRKGDLLVSGFRDLGLCLRAEAAQGEITADTSRRIQAILPTERTSRGRLIGHSRKFSLILGKKRINFYKGSGISHAGCVKMSCVKRLTFPGGFVLPAALVTEHLFTYELTPGQMDPASSQKLLRDAASHWIRDQMAAGRILDSRISVWKIQNGLKLSGDYACREMIGRAKIWEIADNYGKNCGTDRERGAG